MYLALLASVLLVIRGRIHVPALNAAASAWALTQEALSRSLRVLDGTSASLSLLGAPVSDVAHRVRLDKPTHVVLLVVFLSIFEVDDRWTLVNSKNKIVGVKERVGIPSSLPLVDLDLVQLLIAKPLLFLSLTHLYQRYQRIDIDARILLILG